MSGIDDPMEAVKQQYREQPDRVVDLILDVAGSLHPFAGVANAIRNHFSGNGAKDRTKALLEVIEQCLREQDADLHRIRDRMESPEFVHSLIVAVTEAIRSPDPQQIVRFGAVLGHAVTDGVDLSEAAAFVRDLAQLTEADLQAINILYKVQGPLVDAPVVTTDVNRYTESVNEVFAAVDAARIPRDDFYARCSRLHGFGLALEVQRNEVRYGPADHCFRLTKRAATLVRLLRGIGASAA